MAHPRHRGSLQLRLRNMNIEGYDIKKIDVRGVFPKTALHADVEFVVSIFDCTDGGIHPVLSTEIEFQEQFTMAYGSCVSVGTVLPHNKKVGRWMPVAAFAPQALLGPYGGKRTLVAIVRLIDTEGYVCIEAGRILEECDEALWEGQVRFQCLLSDVGYIKLAKEHRRVESMVIRLAAAAAAADGSLDSEEMMILQRKIYFWISRAEVRFDGLSGRQRSNSYGGMMKRAVAKARANEINTASLLKSMRTHADRGLWIETLELCNEVMSVGGTTSGSQLRLLREIANSSSLDVEYLEKFRDRYAIDLMAESPTEVSVEEMLGIDKRWDREEVRRFLRLEYKKWNGRLNMAPEGKHRVNTQRILDMIGEAYKEYTFPRHESKAAAKGPQISQAIPADGQASQATARDGRVSRARPSDGQTFQAVPTGGQASRATTKDDQDSESASKEPQASKVDPLWMQLDLFEDFE